MTHCLKCNLSPMYICVYKGARKKSIAPVPTLLLRAPVEDGRDFLTSTFLEANSFAIASLAATLGHRASRKKKVTIMGTHPI